MDYCNTDIFWEPKSGYLRRINIDHVTRVIYTVVYQAFFTELGRLRFLLNRIRYWSKMSNLNFWKCENLRLCLCNTVCYTVCIDLWLKNGSVRGWITKRKNIYINESLFLLLILNRAESEWESTGVVLTDSGWLLSRFANTNKVVICNTLCKFLMFLCEIIKIFFHKS